MPDMNIEREPSNQASVCRTIFFLLFFRHIGLYSDNQRISFLLVCISLFHFLYYSLGKRPKKAIYTFFFALPAKINNLFGMRCFSLSLSLSHFRSLAPALASLSHDHRVYKLDLFLLATLDMIHTFSADASLSSICVLGE